jgi:hypothetical protein
MASGKPDSDNAPGNNVGLSALENTLLSIATQVSAPDPTAAQVIWSKMKPEHYTAFIEFIKLARTHTHDVEMARIQTSSAAEQERIKQQAAAEQLRLKNDAELTRAGPRLVLLLIVIAFVFILLASAVFLGFQKPDLLPQIITAGLGLVTGLAGGYGIGRATSPSPKP